MNKKDLSEYLKNVPDDAEIAMEIVCGTDCEGISFGWPEFVSKIKQDHKGKPYVVLKELIG